MQSLNRFEIIWHPIVGNSLTMRNVQSSWGTPSRIDIELGETLNVFAKS